MKMDYRKYYFLDEYLFGEVRNNFKRRHFLLPEEFFCIVIWKANRAKTKIKNKLLKIQHQGHLEDKIKKLTQQIFKVKGRKERLEILMNQWGFGLPMATAILTVLYPRDFTIYDDRVRGQLKLRKMYCGERYFDEYWIAVKKRGVGKTLREKDAWLWGKSFHEDLMEFLGNK